MTLHLGHRNSEQQNEIREARKILKERVRTDWEWPVLPAHRQADSGRKSARNPSASRAEDDDGLSAGGFRVHVSPQQDNGRNYDFEPVEWRERSYSSADSDTDRTAVDEKGSKYKDKIRFKFEAPESVGKQVIERRLAQKRKRQKALAEEMAWNDGLAHWQRRRDVWCGALTSAQIQNRSRSPTTRPSADSNSPTTESSSPSSTNSSTDNNNNNDNNDNDNTPRSSTSFTKAPATITRTKTNSVSSSSSSDHHTHRFSSSTSSSSSSTSSQSSSVLPILLIPVAPQILPNHPIRRRISPSMYTEIYSKIILQSRTPSVPINLQTLINALVKGWKDDGEWPPKTTTASTALAGGGGTTAGGGAGGGGTNVAFLDALTGATATAMKKSKKQKAKTKKDGLDDGGGGGGESPLKSSVRAFGRVLRLSTGGGGGGGGGS